MHEIGVLFEVVKTVEKFARENDVKKIETLVLQIGELSSVVPRYMKNLYPAAIEESILEDSKLEIQVLPANALCKDCNKVFALIKNKGICPKCNSKNYEILGGREFFIKEIVCY